MVSPKSPSSSSFSSAYSSSSLAVTSNLQCFLEAVTPIVPSRTLPQSRMSDSRSLLHLDGCDNTEFFMLGDLWGCFEEWSAYGIGISIALDNDETVHKYYVPHLSAMQIFTNSYVAPPRNETHLVDFVVESWSDGSESDKLSRSLSNISSKTWDASSGDSSIELESTLSVRDRFGHLYFQFSDTRSPYWRMPLAYQVAEFAQNYPGLETLTSIDLSPASWMSVAWYPIYHIPVTANAKDLSSCFLTYHTLSSSFQDTAVENIKNDTGKDTPPAEVVEDQLGNHEPQEKSNRGISLPPFGLATYRMHGDIWINPGANDHKTLLDLHNAADSWLKQLSYWHYDFNFFALHSEMESF